MTSRSTKNFLKGKLMDLLKENKYEDAKDYINTHFTFNNRKWRSITMWEGSDNENINISINHFKFLLEGCNFKEQCFHINKNKFIITPCSKWFLNT